MSPEQHKRKEAAAEAGDRTGLLEEERSLDAWSRCLPIHLAGCEDDPSETHILRGLD